MFNNFVNRGTGFSPFEVTYNIKPHLALRTPTLKTEILDSARILEELKMFHEDKLKKIRKNLIESKKKYEKEVTSRRTGPTPLYDIGDKILVKSLRKSPLSKAYTVDHT